MSKKILPVLILIAGVAVFVLLSATRPEPPKVSATERSWLVQVQPVSPARRSPVLALYGEVVAPDLQTVTATLAGQIDALPVSEGDRVKRGDLLVALDTVDIEPVLARARADVADLQAQIDSERVRYRNDQRALESEQSILANARRQFRRIESLAERDMASEGEREAATDAFARAELTVTTRQRAIEEHPARLQSLEARLTRARASLATTELDSRRARAKAPFDGVVTNLQVAEGDRVSPNQTLLSVYPREGLEVRATVPRVFQKELTDALGRGERLIARAGNQEFVLTRFAGLSDAAGTEAVFELQGPPEGLRPGSLQTLELQRPARDDAVEVPFSALYGADSVYVMTDDNRMQRLTVERIGEADAREGERRLLITGEALEPGMRLITTHLPNAVTGLRVRLAETDGEPSS
ncbi:efflux RND transporter periplasmic adaptor subunit [Marinobacter oulmenensis]|uniref:Multidrug efflux pump subunit AcrA (Membrane-fusion protein) n=1 Tax=Marinobacter oulmenensis TaxID=643747 RepID=A0A840UE93_9GAMM|nr:biotin/lipoyl-binding protein [Marinobacter oulmenensis]MBB5321021.1 multidrug efflux pump subunit AcrA (membrane-fusion protein) [Marinobacter oulmenensis]